MRSNRVRECWAAGQPVISAWLSIGSGYAAEIAGSSGVDCAVVDLQHGMSDIQGMIAMLQAISATPAAPLVRVPSLDPPLIMKALDAGAYGVICPMINTVKDAEVFIATTRYPPYGCRSFGPARGLLYGGADYFAAADQTIIRLAMIETEPGLTVVEDICCVDGVDGIFIGPNDLSLALGRGPSNDPTDDVVVKAVARCCVAARSKGKHAGIFSPSGASAAARIAEGFDFVVPNSDANLLRRAMTAEANAARA